MTTTQIRQKLYEYIRVADAKKVRAIFTLVADDIDDYDWTKDKKLIAELNKRSADLKSGKVKGIPWEEAKLNITTKRAIQDARAGNVKKAKDTKDLFKKILG